jgi:hypothetical protein
MIDFLFVILVFSIVIFLYGYSENKGILVMLSFLVLTHTHSHIHTMKSWNPLLKVKIRIFYFLYSTIKIFETVSFLNFNFSVCSWCRKKRAVWLSENKRASSTGKNIQCYNKYMNQYHSNHCLISQFGIWLCSENCTLDTKRYRDVSGELSKRRYYLT